MARLTTRRLSHPKPKPAPRLESDPHKISTYLVEKHTAKCINRRVRLNRDKITVTLPPAAALFMWILWRFNPDKKKRRRPPASVTFAIAEITEMKWRPGWGPIKPEILFYVPGKSNQWSWRALIGLGAPYRFRAYRNHRDDLFWVAMAILWIRPDLRTHPWRGFRVPTGKPGEQRRPPSWWQRTFGTRTRYMRGEMGSAPRRHNPETVMREATAGRRRRRR